jgi:hypothetical protein
MGIDDRPSDTVRLTVVPGATEDPGEGLEAITVPAGDPELGTPDVVPRDKPTWRSALTAATWFSPRMCGTTTKGRFVDVVQAERVTTNGGTITAATTTFPSRTFIQAPSPTQTANGNVLLGIGKPLFGRSGRFERQ